LTGLSERDREAVSLFVDEMRAMRESRGWSQAELARQASCSESLIAMVETYQRAPSQSLARAIDRAFGTPGFTEDQETGAWTPGTFVRLWQKLRTVSFPMAFRPFAEREAVAIALRTFEHSFVPGLLQTADYARAVVATKLGATEADIETDVSDRIARQWILTRDVPPPPRLWVLIDEGILYRPVAPAVVMRDQLDHLIAMSQLPSVTIQVVPYAAGGHSGLLGAFILADLAATQSIVFLDDASGGHVAEDAPVVSDMALRFDALRSDALPKVASRDLIAKVAREQWTA
jgi:transcriptional regulator with XRE-family HTH domain